MNEDLSSTKLDIILQSVNRTNLALEEIKGDLKVQATVIDHVATQYHELKADTKEEFVTVVKKFEKVDTKFTDIEDRLDDLNGFKKWLFGAAAGVGLIAAVITSGIISLLQGTH